MLLALAIAAQAPALAERPDPAVLAPEGRRTRDIGLDKGRKPLEVLDFLGVKPGDQILDFFAGGGYYSQILARLAGPEGHVTAFEPSQIMRLESIYRAWRAIEKTEKNVRVLSMPMRDFKVPDGKYDFALLHLNYHDLYWRSQKENYPPLDPAKILAELYEGMKPGGIVGVVDHIGPLADPRLVVEKLHRIAPKTVRADFEHAGFVLEAQSDLLRVKGDDMLKSIYDPAVCGRTDRFVMRFRKPPV